MSKNLHRHEVAAAVAKLNAKLPEFARLRMSGVHIYLDQNKSGDWENVAVLTWQQLQTKFKNLFINN